jgi:hypothetical protein
MQVACIIGILLIRLYQLIVKNFENKIVYCKETCRHLISWSESKILPTFLICLMSAACPAHLILPYIWRKV